MSETTYKFAKLHLAGATSQACKSLQPNRLFQIASIISRIQDCRCCRLQAYFRLSNLKHQFLEEEDKKEILRPEDLEEIMKKEEEKEEKEGLLVTGRKSALLSPEMKISTSLLK